MTEHLYIVGSLEGSINRLAARIEREGGIVHDLQPMSSLLKVSGVSRRALQNMPGVRYVQADGEVKP